MASSPIESSAERGDPPANFEAFVAQHRGLQAPEAASLLVEWLSTYQPLQPSPWVAPHRTP